MKPEKRRAEILSAATTVFAKKGYHRASVTDIIKTADIARGTFYLYFEGKREIFVELVDVLTVRLMNCMRRVDLSDESTPWLEQIRANIHRIANILVEEKELTQILYNHAMGLDEDFDKKIQEFYQNLTGRTAGAIKLGQDMKLIRKSVSPDLVAYNMVGGIKEVMFRVASGDLEMPVEEMVDGLIAQYTTGILAEPAKKKAARKSSRKR